MKNKLVFTTIVLFLGILFFVYTREGVENLNKKVSINHIENIDKQELQQIIDEKKQTKYNLLEFKYKDSYLAYDEKTDKYFFSTKTDYDFDVYYDKHTTIKKFVTKDKIEIVAYNKNKYKKYNIILTQLPIVKIDLNVESKDKDNLIPDKYTNGFITIFDGENVKVKNSLAKLKVRGNSSIFNKQKSYTINFIDSYTGKDIVKNNVLNMDSNTKYALTSLYEDDSKIRDMMGMKTWKKIGGNGALDIEYVEVIINNNYYGLYVLQEIINEYTFNIDTKKDIIYKINGYRVPKISDFDNNKNKFDDTEVVFVGSECSDKWKKLKELVDLIYYSDDDEFNNRILDYVDMNNEVNYFILLELMYAKDNRWKNSVFIYDDNTNTMKRIAWDLDSIFGTSWDPTVPSFSTYHMSFSKKLLYEYDVDKNKLPTYLEKRLWDNDVNGFRKKVAERWKELRSDFLDTENYIKYTNDMYDQLTECGARERQHLRWPESGYTTDNSFIDKFIRTKLEYLDSEFLTYLDTISSK